MELDYIIVGQGIAGTLLDWFLEQEGQEGIVIDEGHHSAASGVAAGMMNPITGRRLVKSWKIEELLPFAKSTYRELEDQLNTHLLTSLPIYRPYSNPEQKRIWYGKRETKEYKKYDGGEQSTPWDVYVEQPWNGFMIERGGWVNMPLLIEKYRSYLQKQGRLEPVRCHYKDLNINGKVNWQDYVANKLIFCEGYQARSNPFFHRLPFKLAKGEVVEIEAADWPQDFILNRGIYIIPLGKDRFYVGATYEWEDISNVPSSNGRQQIIDKLEKVLPGQHFDIIHHYAGVRPTVKDRKPLLGQHPNTSSLYLLNGMGTKGATLAPYFAQQLISFMKKDQSLPEKVNVQRVYK